ncbi:MAG: hypothetical protein QNJ06_10330 [Kiloniellales bacterium]|nr:hypothetical protein [Kiloniellales bacterium]
MSPFAPALEAPSPFFETRRSPSPAAAGVFCFSIQAEAEPSVMSRVLELFAKRNLVPSRWVSDLVGPGGRELSIDLQVRGLSGETAHYVARCLRQLHYVDSVLISEKRVS